MEIAPIGTEKATGSNLGPREMDLGKDDFLMLLLQQLKNQDPLEPMDNSAFIAQLAQFRSLESLQQVSQDLTSLLEVQSLGQASSLIGREIEGLSTDGEMIKGLVMQASMFEGVAKLKVGDKDVQLDKVTHVSEASS